MNFLTLENVSLRYGEKLFFDQIKLYINKGQKVALVAKNGTGKSTLLKILMGEVKPDGDTYKSYLRPDIRIGYLPQEPQLNMKNTVLDEIYETEDPKVQAIYQYEQKMLLDNQSAIAEAAHLVDSLHAWDVHGRIGEILYQLKIDYLSQSVQSLSGGQAKRVALAKIIIQDPDFLILDEPTNHLDIDMIEWLEKYLSKSQLTLFMVTHDRYFLERVCNQIVELEQGKIYTYPGNYSEYLERKAIRNQNETAAVQKARKLITTELDWMRRMPKARGTKAKARIDKFFETQNIANINLLESEMVIEIEPTRLGSKILEMQYISKSFGDLVILQDFHYKFKKGERVGIVGPNGAGKTTFIKLLIGEEQPTSGKIIVGDTVRIGYYSQEGLILKEDQRVIEVIRDIAEYLPGKKGTKVSAERLLEYFLFDRAKQQVYVSQLSGGEKRRLHLLQVLMSNPNFLILDEPTNDLDIITLNVLEEFLLNFEGCVVIITHDRYFLDKIVNHLLIMEGDGKVKDYNHTYTEYRSTLDKTGKPVSNDSSKAETQKDTSYVDLKELKKSIKRTEKKIEKLESRKTEIMDWFSEGLVDVVKSKKLAAELKNIETDIEKFEEEWMELNEEMHD